MSYHVSVDVGGTFTDLFAVDAEAGSVIVQKTDTSEDAVGSRVCVSRRARIADTISRQPANTSGARLTTTVRHSFTILSRRDNQRRAPAGSIMRP